MKNVENQNKKEEKNKLIINILVFVNSILKLLIMIFEIIEKISS